MLAALLRRHAGARVLGERTFGKDYAMRVERIDDDWQALVPDGRLEVPGEVLAGGLRPDGPIPDELAVAAADALRGRARRGRGPRWHGGPLRAQSIAIGEPIEPVAPLIGDGL